MLPPPDRAVPPPQQLLPQPRALALEGQLSLYTSPSLPNISLGLQGTAAASHRTVSPGWGPLGVARGGWGPLGGA